MGICFLTRSRNRLGKKIRDILRRDRSEMFIVKRLPVGLERAPRPFAEYVARALSRNAVE